jgi:hypothetical protein
MAIAVCLQDWITLQGNSNTITQADVDYVDLSNFKDMAVYVEISAYTNVTLSVQTSPTRETSYFTTPADGRGGSASFNPTAPGVQTVFVTRQADANATIPGTFARWTATNNIAGAWNITFRIWLSLNQS